MVSQCEALAGSFWPFIQKGRTGMCGVIPQLEKPVFSGAPSLCFQLPVPGCCH